MYADDCGLVAYTEDNMQHLMDTFVNVYMALWLTLNKNNCSGISACTRKALHGAKYICMQ